MTSISEKQVACAQYGQYLLRSLLIVALSFFWGVSVCATAAEMDSQIAACEGPDFSTRVEACQLAKQLQALENKLQHKYLQAIKSYQKNTFRTEKSMLIASQRAWINYRNKTCNFENQAYGGLYSISRLRCLVRLAEARADEIYAEQDDE